MLYQCLGVTIDTERYHVYVFGNVKRLSDGEFRILTRLMHSRGRFLSREVLFTECKHPDKSIRNVDVMIKRIRRRLFSNPHAGRLFIECRYNVGYRIPTRDQLNEKYPP